MFYEKFSLIKGYNFAEDTKPLKNFFEKIIFLSHF